MLLAVTSQCCNKLKQLITYGVSRVESHIVTIRDTESVRIADLNPSMGIVQGKTRLWELFRSMGIVQA